MFKERMLLTMWTGQFFKIKCPLQNQTHRTAQKHAEHQYTTDIQNELFFCVFGNFLILFCYLIMTIIVWKHVYKNIKQSIRTLNTYKEPPQFSFTRMNGCNLSLPKELFLYVILYDCLNIVIYCFMFLRAF